MGVEIVDRRRHGQREVVQAIAQHRLAHGIGHFVQRDGHVGMLPEELVEEARTQKAGHAQRAGDAQLHVAARRYALERAGQQVALGAHALGILVQLVGVGRGAARTVLVHREKRHAQLALEVADRLREALRRHRHLARGGTETGRIVCQHEVVVLVLHHRMSLPPPCAERAPSPAPRRPLYYGARLDSAFSPCLKLNVSAANNELHVKLLHRISMRIYSRVRPQEGGR